MEVVYHSSPLQQLSHISPYYSQHFKKDVVYANLEKDVVYANLDKAASSISLGRFIGDYACWPSVANGSIVINEHFKGAFNLRYGAENGPRKGSIYWLDASKFFLLPGLWRGEMISLQDIAPLHEEPVEDVYRYINDLLDDGTLDLKIANKHFEELPNYKSIIMDIIRVDDYRKDMKRYNPKTFRKWIKMIGAV